MSGNEINSYCREIETYLTRKNDGHLIRVVGPSFELVSRWAADGIPLKIAFRGIDRCFERYYRKGPRRRPVKIDFCEADVLDAFDEWKRATLAIAQPSVGSRQSAVDSRRSAVESPQSSVGVSDVSGLAAGEAQGRRRDRGPSLPAHLQRVVLRLTSARAGGTLGAEFDALLDGIGRELDAARARSVRGEARDALVARLSALDDELLRLAREALGAEQVALLAREADEELRPFRATMSDEAYARVREAATDRLVRERLNLPVVRYSTLG